MKNADQNPLGIRPFDAAEYLDSEDAIAEYLNVSMESNDPAIIMNALATVARARGMTQLAKDAGVGRESLYKALAPDAHPRFETVVKLMNALQLGLRAVPLVQARQAVDKALDELEDAVKGAIEESAAGKRAMSTKRPSRAAAKRSSGRR